MEEHSRTKHVIGKDIRRFIEITSTNVFAKQLIANDEPVHGTVILADHQTSGVGQKGNTWQSAAGKNLLCSIILLPSKPIQTQFFLNKAIAIAIASTIKEEFIEEVKIKWPNDIYVGQQKIAGILIENSIRQNLYATAVVGIGINVNQVFFSKDLNATSLKLQTGKEFDILSVAEKLFQSIDKIYQDYLAEDFDIIDDEYHQLLFQKDKIQRFKNDDSEFEGIIKGVDHNGLLLVEIDNTLRSFKNQEIQFIKNNK